MSVLAKILNLFLKTNQMENEMQVRFNSEYLKELPEPFHSQRESLYEQKQEAISYHKPGTFYHKTSTFYHRPGMAKVLSRLESEIKAVKQRAMNSEYFDLLPEPFHSQRESLYKQKSHLVFDCRLNGSEEVSRLND